eukprot:Skav202935  [mRNA]  locus=scaffold422:104964:107580:+ [translate_table: standard]
MGKRVGQPGTAPPFRNVDFCARSVIGGDPNLDTEQVGVPRSVALNLTFPERVTPLNVDRMKKLVANGPTTHPGARSQLFRAAGDWFPSAFEMPFHAL